MANRYGNSNDRRKSPLMGIGRVIVELFVIVVGIYIAFRLENGREDKKIATLEVKYLEQLLEEAQINQSELKSDQDERNIQLVFLDKLLATTHRAVDVDTLRQAMEYLMMIRLYSPTDAVYEDLVSSGNLGIIKSEQTKNLLLRYRSGLSRVPIIERSDLEMIETQLEPYLINKQVLSLLQPFESQAQIRVSQQQVDRIIRVLLADRTFIDLIYLRMHKIRDVIFFENPLQWRLRDMITLLEEELLLLKED